MEGGQVSPAFEDPSVGDRADSQTNDTVGKIPRAIDMIFTISRQLQDRGWKYQMEGQFLEVYNEVVSRTARLRTFGSLQINDLLGSGQFDTKKHEIKLDKDGKMSVTDAVSSKSLTSIGVPWLMISPPQ